MATKQSPRIKVSVVGAQMLQDRIAIERSTMAYNQALSDEQYRKALLYTVATARNNSLGSPEIKELLSMLGYLPHTGRSSRGANGKAGPWEERPTNGYLESIGKL